MKDKPIIFSAAMVLAILDGRKTQTRRVLKPQPPACFRPIGYIDAVGGWRVGQRLWVREVFAYNAGGKETVRKYRADMPYWDEGRAYLWRSPIHMPRWASRITLTVTNVRVQRVQEISPRDILAEGVDIPEHHRGGLRDPHRWRQDHFAPLWNSIHGPDAWDRNDWVAAITFTAEQKNIDA